MDTGFSEVKYVQIVLVQNPNGRNGSVDKERTWSPMAVNLAFSKDTMKKITQNIRECLSLITVFGKIRGICQEGYVCRWIDRLISLIKGKKTPVNQINLRTMHNFVSTCWAPSAIRWHRQEFCLLAEISALLFCWWGLPAVNSVCDTSCTLGTLNQVIRGWKGLHMQTMGPVLEVTWKCHFFTILAYMEYTEGLLQQDFWNCSLRSSWA